MAPRLTTQAPTHLDGTTLEGGGQLLRIALGLSSLTRKPINITSIRGKRSGGGGLKTQHLTCAQWLGKACHARLSGIGLNSKEITFIPAQDSHPFDIEEENGEVLINQKTPGSTSLILQAILPYLLFSGFTSPITVRIKGGTNVSNSPSHDYVEHVLIPMLTLIGIPRIRCQLHSRGWSQGRTTLGSATYTITPLTSSLPAFHLQERGKIAHLKISIIAPRATEKMFRDEITQRFERRGQWSFGFTLDNTVQEITFEDSFHDKRFYILAVATTSIGLKLAADWLYDQSVRQGLSNTKRIVYLMVDKVLKELLNDIIRGTCADDFLRDQLVVFQALARGRSTIRGRKYNSYERKYTKIKWFTLHAQTAMWVAKKMLGVDFDEKGSCVGMGFTPGGGLEAGEEEATEDNQVEDDESSEDEAMTEILDGWRHLNIYDEEDAPEAGRASRN